MARCRLGHFGLRVCSCFQTDQWQTTSRCIAVVASSAATGTGPSGGLPWRRVFRLGSAPESGKEERPLNTLERTIPDRL